MDFPCITVRGALYSLERPRVMGIVNVTPDSFYGGSRTRERSGLLHRLEQMVADGVDMIDLGGYSSRPGADEVSEQEEYERLALGMEVIGEVCPDLPVSIDTFRASVARRCVEELGADIINDISGGLLDPLMPATAAELQVPVVVMHMRGTPATMQQLCEYSDPVADVLSELAERVSIFRQAGVADVIADPGLGFAKTTEQNYAVLRNLEAFKALNAPLLVGLSRKSMIYKPLGITPADALPGTIALNMAALERGASILRVHDVKQAMQTVQVFLMLQSSK